MDDCRAVILVLLERHRRAISNQVLLLPQKVRVNICNLHNLPVEENFRQISRVIVLADCLQKTGLCLLRCPLVK